MADLTSLLSRFLNALYTGSASMPVGSGTATATIGGVLEVDTTSAGTAADTTETDLWSYSLPANTLNANGKGVRITIVGRFAANTNNKTLRPYFGSQTLTSNASASASALRWRYEFEVVRTGAATQVGSGIVHFATAFQDVPRFAGTQDATAAITIKITGQNGTASANDIIFDYAIVESLN